MSLDVCLESLGFTSLDQVTSESLKASFHTALKEDHPDKGGTGELFDLLLSSYLFLKRILQRKTGGRDNQVVLDSRDVQEAREKQMELELGIELNSILEEVQQNESNDFLRVFNAHYEQNCSEEKGDVIPASESRGYRDWLSSSDSLLSTVSFQPDGLFGNLTMAPPVIQEADFGRIFEYTARSGKPLVTALALHPDEMALRVSSGGMLLIPSATDSFTSQGGDRPEYTDLQDAYTRQNTLVDKLPVFEETGRTFEDLLKERDMVYQTEEDRDMATIAAYEKRYQEEEAEHKRRVEVFFQSTGSSQWALRGVSGVAGSVGSSVAGIVANEDGDEKE